jgi:hypothetical protein
MSEAPEIIQLKIRILGKRPPPTALDYNSTLLAPM